MITKLTGTLVSVRDEDCRVAVGPFEYQVMLPEAVRMQVQMKIGEAITFHISEYLEGGPNANKFIPRKIGFLHDDELEFFDLFCTVDKIGVKKALKALARPIRDIANAISREDSKWLTTLPGIGATTAEQIVTSLKRKVTKFAVAQERSIDGKQNPQAKLFDDVYQALINLGMSPFDARTKVDGLVKNGQTYASADEAIMHVFKS
jgi:holliday junction DNA helicase RuvA